MTIQLENLGVVREGKKILDGVSCELPARRLTVVIGPNGAGKSTLLKTIAGIETADAGRVRFGDDDVTNLPAHRLAREVSWTPAESDVPFAFSVAECVTMGRFPWHRGTPGPADDERSARALAQLGITELAGRAVPTLSSGERLKVVIARALAGDAPRLLFDEPTANLDVGAALSLMALLKEVSREKTVVICAHDLSLARRFADHAVCIGHGRVIAHGETARVFTPAVLEEAFGVRTSEVTSPAGAPGLLFDL